jgi:hypothetical protein
VECLDRTVEAEYLDNPDSNLFARNRSTLDEASGEGAQPSSGPSEQGVDDRLRA